MLVHAALLGTLTTGAPAPALATVTVTDDIGRSVTMAGAARRIVSLAPSATELLFAIGAGPQVIAVVARSDFPPAARALPRVGDAHALDLERILADHPDLIVTWPYTVPANVALLRRRGIPVYILDPQSVEGIATTMERLGALAGTGPEATRAAMALRRKFALLRDRYRDRPVISVFYEIWNVPLITLGGQHLVSRAIETCGGRNVFAGLRLPAPEVSVEAVLAAAPEMIVAGADGGHRPPWLDAWRRWPTLPAVRDDNLEVVNADFLHRAGPRFVDGVAQLCAVLERGRRHRAASQQRSAPAPSAPKR